MGAQVSSTRTLRRGARSVTMTPVRDGARNGTPRERIIAAETAAGSRRALARQLAGEGAEGKTVERWRRALYRYIEDGVAPDDANAEAMAASLGKPADYFKRQDPRQPRRYDVGTRRLEALEATVDRILELNETSFAAIHETLARLEARLDALAAPGGRRSRGAM